MPGKNSKDEKWGESQQWEECIQRTLAAGGENKGGKKSR